MQRYLVDIDEHIFFSEKEKCKECGRIKYKLKLVDKKEIDKINEKYDNGDEIILWTSRGWSDYDEIYKQLKEKDVKFHQLIMGKMSGIYVDKKALHSIGDIQDV